MFFNDLSFAENCTNMVFILIGIQELFCRDLKFILYAWFLLFIFYCGTFKLSLGHN